MEGTSWGLGGASVPGDAEEETAAAVRRNSGRVGEGRAVLPQLPLSGTYFVCVLHLPTQRNDILVEASLLKMQLFIF